MLNYNYIIIMNKYKNILDFKVYGKILTKYIIIFIQKHKIKILR